MLKFNVEEIPETTTDPLSVIICARNEAKNLETFLPAILNQNHPNFEVVVVNDRSWDATEQVLEQLKLKYEHLKLVTVLDSSKFLTGKKFAVTMGIKAAKHDWLVFTDADCEPTSENWLLDMQQPEEQRTEILLGYSPYLRRKGLLNALIRFETFFTALNYLSFALKGMPYMGVGRNLAYRKSLFFKNKGFAAHMHIPSGDDDLFVNANATKNNTEIRINKQAQVFSVPNTTWRGYLRQKKRHFGAGKMYRAKHKFVLSLQIITQFLFYTLIISCLFVNRDTQLIAVAIFLLFVLMKVFIYPKLLNKLNCASMRWWFPILEILLFFFLVINGFLGLFGNKKVHWK
ncbi:glycosyltransferase [Pedobacter sp. UYP30]|uniref:glycosyltransferase n=1 Tax=Pedobacter sp. UYP30 TaxID=1756400 RepID=UPI003395A83B